jgi:hypothetical protein
MSEPTKWHQRGSSRAKWGLSRDERWAILISYDTPVAAWDKKLGVHYVSKKKYSVTTSRHINAWLDGTIPEFKKPAKFFRNLLNEEFG